MLQSWELYIYYMQLYLLKFLSPMKLFFDQGTFSHLCNFSAIKELFHRWNMKLLHNQATLSKYVKFFHDQGTLPCLCNFHDQGTFRYMLNVSSIKKLLHSQFLFRQIVKIIEISPQYKRKYQVKWKLLIITIKISAWVASLAVNLKCSTLETKIY